MREFLNKFIYYLIWPLTLLFGIIGLWYLQKLGIDGFIALFIISISTLLIFMALEFKIPYNKEWSPFKDKQSINDILHFFTTEIAAAGFNVFIVLIASFLAVKDGIWPSDLPLYLQLIIAIFLIDFIDYWRHRLSHTFVFWWRLHVLHHSVSKMHIFKATRHYFVDMMWASFVMNIPLIILGAPKEVFLWHALFVSLLAILTHANVRMAFPKFFHYIFITAPVHFIHHSIILKEGNSNYGTIFSFWDILFGTFTDPNKRENPIELVGIENDPVPSSYFKQLIFPFTWNGKN